jgi:hypothetical protein
MRVVVLQPLEEEQQRIALAAFEYVAERATSPPMTGIPQYAMENIITTPI